MGQADDLGKDLGEGDGLLRGHGAVCQVDAFQHCHLGQVSADKVSENTEGEAMVVGGTDLRSTHTALGLELNNS